MYLQENSDPTLNDGYILSVTLYSKESLLCVLHYSGHSTVDFEANKELMQLILLKRNICH
jgi:hypothetical protein